MMNKFKRTLAGMLAACMVMTNALPVFAESVPELVIENSIYEVATPSEVIEIKDDAILAAAPLPGTQHAISSNVIPADSARVVLSKDDAAAGETVTFIIENNSDLSVSKVFTAPETEISVSDEEIYSFEMPSEDITVNVELSNCITVGKLVISADEPLVYNVDYAYSDECLTIMTDMAVSVKNFDPQIPAADHIYIPANVAARLILCGVNIRTDRFDTPAICVAGDSDQTVRITLADGMRNILYAVQDSAIRKQGDSGRLVIDGEGFLDARTDADFCPVIGGRGTASKVSGVGGIEINGGHLYIGTITERDASVPAYTGIGGGYNAAASDIFINGGEITFEGFKNPVGGGYDPYGDYSGSGNIVFSKEASIRAGSFTDAIPVATAGSTEELVLCSELPMTEGMELSIDGTLIPGTAHDDGVTGTEQKRYIYLTPASADDPHEIVTDGRSAIHIYYENGEWVTAEGEFQDPIRFDKKDVILARQDYIVAKYGDNPVINNNRGAITAYSSSNSTVAAVDSDGNVTVYSAGKVTITAISKKDGCPDVSASYTLTVKERHNIQTLETEHGSYKLDKSFAMEGEEITISPEPAEGYCYFGYVIRNTDNDVILQGSAESFTMPDEEISFSCRFMKPSVQIVVRQDPSGCGLISAPASARPGETVYVSSVPEKGYELKTFDVTDKDDRPLLVEVFTDQFIMPDDVPGGLVYIIPWFGLRLYRISAENVSHGTIAVIDDSGESIVSAYMGDIVRLWAAADPDYSLSSLRALDSKGNELALEDQGGGYYRFIMPASDVTVRPEFTRISHEISIELASLDEGGFGGTVTAFNGAGEIISRAVMGEEVTLKADPEVGYALSYLHADPDVTLSKISENLYSFEMPGEDLLIRAAFAKATEEGTKEKPWKIGTEENPGGIIAYIGGDSTLYVQKGEGVPAVMKDFDTDGHPAPYSYSMPRIKEIVVSEGVPNIGNHAFYNAYSVSYLTEVSLPDTLTGIGKYALSGFPTLKKLTIPADVICIGANAFAGDTGLQTVVFEGKPGDFSEVDDEAFAGVTADVHVPSDWLAEDGKFDSAACQFGGKLTYIVEGTGTQHVVNVRQPEHGIMKYEKNLYDAGDTVTVTLKNSAEDFGWYPDRFSITPYVSYTETTEADGKQIRFVMPECDVEISAIYTSPGTESKPWLIGFEDEEPKQYKDDIYAWCSADPADSAKKILSISPRRENAVMVDFETGSRPWDIYADEISGVVVTETDYNCYSIGGRAFEGLSSLKAADLGSRTGVIGDAAFSGCTALENVSMPGVKRTKKEAFANCVSLVSIDSMDLNDIGERSFYGCTSFTGNVVMDGKRVLDLTKAHEIYKEAFAGCTSLETFRTSNESIDGCILGTIPEKAFSGCSSLVDVTLAGSVKRIEAGAFADCVSLAKFQICGLCKDISATAFLNDAVKIRVTYDFLAARNGEDTLPHINDPGGRWYYGAKQLTYIVSTTPMEDYRSAVKINQTKRGTVKLFRQGCTGGERNRIEIVSGGGLWKGEIVEIKVGGNTVSPGTIGLNELTYIKDIPGYERTRLFEFVMPTSTDHGAADVEFKISFEEDPSDEDFLGTEPGVPLPKRQGQPWNIAADGSARIRATLEDGILHIEHNAPAGYSAAMMDFYGSSAPWYSVKNEITKVVIDEGITTIGESAFLNCKNLESAVIPETVTKIGADAFYASGIQRLDIPAGVKEIGREAFYGCRDLSEVNYEGCPERIHSQAFRNSALTCYVTDEWLSGGVALGDLNDKGGEYQYGGTIDYVCASGAMHSITIDPSEGGTVTVPFDKAAKGTLVIFDPAPEYGYRYETMISSGVSVSYNDRSFVMPAGDVTLTPVFVKNRYYVYSDGGEGVSLSVEKSSYYAGETVKIISETDPGYIVTKLGVRENRGDRSVEVASDGTFTMPAFDVRIYAGSEKINYNVTVLNTEEGIAFVNDSRGIQGERITACAGDTLKLSATPVPGRKLKEWQIKEASGTKITTGENTYTMPACDITVTPVFGMPYALEILKAAGGRVTCDAAYAFAEDTVQLNISPEPGYEFSGWEEKPSSLEIAEDGSFVMPEENVSVKAAFRRIENTRSIMSATDGNGTITIAAESRSGGKVTFTALPNPGYRLRKVSVKAASGVSVMVTGNSFIMPDSDVSVTAEFEKIPHTVKLIVSGEEYGSAALVSSVTAGIGDTVRFTAQADTDCRIGSMVVSPWADITAGSDDTYSFSMPDTDADIIVEFVPVRGTETYPWLIGRDVPENVRATDGHSSGPGLLITGLYIEGNGTEEMMNFADGGAPWAEKFGEKIGDVYFVDVVNISDYAVAGNYSLHEVKICETVKNIGKGAFKGCRVDTAGRIIFYGKPDRIEPDAFEGVEARVSVGRSWLCGGLTVDDLNRADGPYQYGGHLTYEVRSGDAEIRLQVNPYVWKIHGTVTVQAEKTGDAYIYRADKGETVFVNYAADEGYYPNAYIRIYSGGSGEEGSMISDRSFMVPEEEFDYVELTVTFKPINCLVTYDFSGRGEPMQYNNPYGEVISEPSIVPVIEGLEIEGWYTDPDFTKKWNFSSDRLAGDITLYAKWVPKQYEITWKNDDGSVLKKTNTAYGEFPSYDGEIPQKTGAEAGKKYVFSGWTPNLAKVTGAAAYTAGFDAVDEELKTVLFDMNGHGDIGPVPHMETLTAGFNVTEPQDPSDSDYVFGGWFRDRACTEGCEWNFVTDTVSDEVTTLYAKWTLKTCDVTWKDHDDRVLKKTAAAKGTYAVYTGAIPKRTSTAETDYVFSGWDPTPGLVTKNTEYTAKYTETPRQYIVSFDNGGKGRTPAAQSVTFGEKIPAPGDLTETGYVFGGWYSEATCASKSKWIFETDTMPAKALTLYAKWIPKVFYITWKDDDGSVLRVQTVDYNTVPVYDGKEPYHAPDGAFEYQFAGWTPGIKRADRNETYTAVYDELARRYTVTFDTNGKGTGGCSYKADSGSRIEKPEDPTAEEYDFAGWYKDAPCSVGKEFDFDKETMPPADLTLYARWVVKHYRIVWKNYDGSVLQKDENALYGSLPEYTGPAPEKPETETQQFTFTGWSPKVVTVMQDAVYTAQYSAEDRFYTVTWQNDDGTLIGRSQMKYGETPSHEPPTKAGYVFTGWEPKLRPVTADITYKAVFVKKTEDTVTVTFDTDGGSAVDTQVIARGVKAERPADPVKTGYTFAGWYTDNTYTSAYDFSKPVEKDVVVYAKWTQNIKKKFTVTFETDGGSAVDAQVIAEGGTAERPADPVKEGYTFVGWYTDNTYTSAYDFSKPVEKDTVLYAKYDIKKKPDPPEPDPVPVRRSSSSFFTGTWGHPAADGRWHMDADGVWYYETTRMFCNTWGYIVNPYAGEGQNKADWFWFDGKGRMLTGWQFINGKWYFLNTSRDGTLGACQLGGVTPDGWSVDESGAWIESIPKK